MAQPRKRGERKERPQDKYQDPRQLFVGQLPPDVTEEGLMQILSQYGEVEHVQILRGPGGVSKGCGFVHMRDPKNADDAIGNLSNKQQIEGANRPLCVNRGGAKNNEKNFSGARVYVANISRDSKEDDLRQRFSEYGEVQELYLMKEYKDFRKTALILFTTKEEAQRAVTEVHGKIKDGTHPRPLIVRFADSKISLDPQTTPYKGKITVIANPSRLQYAQPAPVPAPIPIPYPPPPGPYLVPTHPHAAPYPIPLAPSYPQPYYAPPPPGYAPVPPPPTHHQSRSSSSRSRHHQQQQQRRSRSDSPDDRQSGRSPSRSPSPVYQSSHRPTSTSSSSSRRNGPSSSGTYTRSSGTSYGGRSGGSTGSSGGSRDYSKSRSYQQDQYQQYQQRSTSPSRSRSRSPPQHKQSSSRRTSTYTYTTPVKYTTPVPPPPPPTTKYLPPPTYNNYQPPAPAAYYPSPTSYSGSSYVKREY